MPPQLPTEFFIAPDFNQSPHTLLLDELDACTTCIYFVDVCSAVALLAGFTKESLLETSAMREKLKAGAPGLTDIRKDACSLMAKLPTMAGPARPDLSGYGTLAALGAVLVHDHPHYQEASKSINHWVFLGFRLFDGGYIIDPVLLSPSAADLSRPIPWDVLLDLLKKIVSQKLSKSCATGRAIQKSGGAILALQFDGPY